MFQYPDRGEETSENEIYECMLSSWDEHDVFSSDQLPFFIEMFPVKYDNEDYVGLDLRLQYIEFMEARFRYKNLHYCGKPWEEIVGKCNPRCVRITKTDKKDNQVFLSYDCEYSMVKDGFNGDIVSASGDTILLSVCMMDAGGLNQKCGEYWILMPRMGGSTVLEKTRPDHQVLLLVDKQEYDEHNELIVYVPTSHVLLHDADMLGLQVLTYHSDDPHDMVAHANESCWHDIPGSAIIHTQNVTFTKYPGQNIRGEPVDLCNIIKYFLSQDHALSAKWQVSAGHGALHEG